MNNNSLNAWPVFDSEEIETVKEILSSGKVNYWTGNQGKNFEVEFSNWIGAKKSIAVANGTLALDLALKALGIGSGDKVIVTPRSFIASVSSVVNAGAEPIFCDINRDSGNIDIDSIEDVITDDTKAIICVHLAGWPCDMDPIISLAKHRKIAVIEDCAQAHGATYKNRHVGTIGDIGCWSFCQDKIMTTGGEGGMVSTNSDDLWEKMWSYKDHGKNYYSVNSQNHPPGFRWVHDSFGTNFRMTEIQAAIGRLQLKKMDTWNKKRQHNAHQLIKILNSYKEFLRTPVCNADSVHAYYKLYTYINYSKIKKGWDRGRIISELNQRNIPCFEGSCSEIYKEKAFEGTTFVPKESLTNAKELGETSIVFLVHPTLTKENIAYMQKTITEVLDMVV